jgi:integrase
MRLTAAEVDAATGRGMLGDGEGLYLSIAAGGSKSWIFRYQIEGRRRDLGLGGYPTVSLAKARKRRDAVRAKIREGIDPLEERANRRALVAAEQELREREARRNRMTFKRVAEDFIAYKEAAWSNRKHGQQWRNTLATYAYPVFGAVPVADIETDHVLQVLRSIWTEKTETAKRVQGRLENIFDYCTSMGLRDATNPARWRGHLDHILPKPGRVHRVEHQRALAYRDAPKLTASLRDVDTSASRALLLTLLCATRTSETLEATWAEFDLHRAEWRIPAARMKAGKEHRVPLSAAAVALLRSQGPRDPGDWVFPGQRRGRPLSNMAMTNVLKRLGWLEKTTVHGLRSTFRDWIAEQTHYPERMAEVALAHQLSDKVQAAYFRADLMEQRRAMMDEWAGFLGA